MEHTKEPWRVHLLDRRTMIASDVENGYLAETRHIHSGDIEEINAKRIVACVNACAGITNEALENGLIEHLLNDAYMRTLNPFDPNPQNKQGMTYLGKPIFEEHVDGKE